MTIKVLHTSDWHLGKKLFKKLRVSEHDLFLKWLLETIKSKHINYLLICGDIFDNSTPPNHALKQYFDFLNSVGNETSCKVIVVGGNHDSAAFLNAPKHLLAKNQTQVIAGIDSEFSNHVQFLYSTDKSEYIELKSLPYFNNHEIYNWIKTDTVLENAEEKQEKFIHAIEKFINFKTASDSKKVGSIFAAHHLFGEYEESGSEQSIAISGLNSIPVKLFKNKFDYLALGHIHRPQFVSKANPIAYYPGSVFPMRFSEKANKTIAILNYDNGKLDHQIMEIPVFRKIFQLKLNISNYEEEIEKLSRPNANELTPFVEIIFKLDSPEIGLIDKIKELLGNIGVELLSFIPEYSQIKEKNILSGQKLHTLSTTELFELFYSEKFPESKEVPKNLLNEFKNILEQANNENS